MKRYLFGKWVEATGPLTVDDVADICREAETHRKALAAYPMDKVYRLLEKVRAKWSDPDYHAVKFLREVLPGETGFSPEMLELGLQEIVSVLDTEQLKRKQAHEFRGVPRDGEFAFDWQSQTALRWSPLGTVLHVLAGNVFLVGIGSLVEGLLTGNVTLIKMASGEKKFMPKLMESFLECDEDGVVSRSVALVDYSSSQTDVIAEFKRRVDGLVVWGGEEAVKAYRNDLPARTRLVIFGPKLSFAVVTRAGLEAQGADKVADALAFELAIWDQNACTAPQVCYVEGEAEARRLVEALGAALPRQQMKLPAGETDVNQAVEIGKLRTRFEIAEARGEGMERSSVGSVDWTVVLDRDSAIEPSPLHRTLRVIPVASLDVVVEEAARLRGYIQSVGLAATAAESLALTRRLADEGALRLVELGKMAGGEIDDPHDGAYDLSQLVNFVFTRVPLPRNVAPLDLLSVAERGKLIDERLRALLDCARRASLYGGWLKDVKDDQIMGVADLPKLPVLSRGLMDANMPPKGTKLATTESYWGGYVTRSGGSTGEPKFSVYDGPDWDAMISHAERCLRAAGLERGDRLANFMLAGDLYGSFVSFDHINVRIGVTTFAFAHQLSPEVFVDVWKKFSLNAIQGIPTAILPLLRHAKELHPALTLEKVIYAGNPMSRTDIAWLCRELGVKRIASIIGANDGGQLAFQCEHQSGAMHHLVDDYNYVEIVDDKGQPVADGQPGRILITGLLKKAFPLIRYELGDAARIVGNDCPCGRTTRVIEYLGRADDTVCVGNMNFRYRDVAAALADLPLSAIQLVGRTVDAGDSILLRIETVETTEEMKGRVRAALYAKLDKLEERVEDKSVADFTIELVAPGTLPRNPRTGKIKQLVDERI